MAWFRRDSGIGRGRLPFFKLKSFSGKDVTSLEYEGKVVIVDVWASWCPPCRREIPDLLALRKQYGKQGLMILGLSTDREPAAHTRAAKEMKITYHSCLAYADGGLFMRNYQRALGKQISAIPYLAVFDREGILRFTHRGTIPKAELELVVKKLL